MFLMQRYAFVTKIFLFSLCVNSSTQLSSDSLKEKKKQRLLKAGYEARVRIRKEKEIEKQQKEKDEREQEERDKEERENDLGGWARRLRGEQEVCVFRCPFFVEISVFFGSLTPAPRL